MKTQTKRYKECLKFVDKNKIYQLEEAVSCLKQMPVTKFDQSVELGIDLRIDAKKSDQLIRGTVVLPYGTGKSKRVVVFCKGEQEKEAKEAGADFVGGDELINKVSGGWVDFDAAVATPEMMKNLSKLGKVLGPRGLMPSPKSGTVTVNVAQAVKELKAGKVEFKNDKQGGIHLAVGKVSFDKEKLIENINVLLSALKAGRPASLKGDFIKSISISTTMGPGFKLAVN